MAKVTKLVDVRMSGIVDGLVAHLEDHGHITVQLKDLSVPLSSWRTAAHRAGKILDRKVVTNLTAHGGVRALLTDWPRDDREHAQEDFDRRRPAEAVDAYVREHRVRRDDD